MAQYYNVVTNANGTYTIEDLQQICSINGQSLQFVIHEDVNNVIEVNNDSNVVSQPILYTTTENNETALFPQINLGAHVTTAQLETRPSVYIIKTNNQSVQQSILTKVEPSNSQGDDSKEVKDHINICYAPNQFSNTESIELVIKKDPSPVKHLANIVRSQQPTTLTPIAPRNIIGQGPDKKPTRLVPLNKQVTGVASVKGISKSSLQGTNTQAAKAGKMRRTSNVANSSNVAVTVRPRASTGNVGVNALVTPPRGPQARPPIHPDASQRNSLPANTAKNTASPQVSEPLKTLSERISQNALKQRQQQNERQLQQKQSPPVMVVAPTSRLAQSQQATTPRPQQSQRTMGLFGSRQQQQQQQQLQEQQQHLQQLAEQQKQQQLQLQLQQLHQQQQLQHQQKMLQRQQMTQRQTATVATSQANRQVQTATVTVSDADEPMEVDPSEVLEQIERLSQQLNSSKSESEENSSESVAYLQEEIADPTTAIVQQQITGNEAKMLVILENGEQRLITFEVPKEDCTVQDLLEQANILSSQEPRVSLVSDPALGINYIVDVTRTSCFEDDQQMESASSDTSSVATEQSKTPVKNNPNLPAAARGSFYKKSDPNQKGNHEIIAKRGRGGRGRGSLTRPQRQTKEPVCLTISSDEEEDSKKQKQQEGTKDVSNLLNSANTEESVTISDKEPIINSKTISALKSVKMNQAASGENVDSVPAGDQLSTLLNCRTIRIGSYKYIPTDSVEFTSNGLKLEVPLLEDEKNIITVNIKLEDLIAVLIHFNKSMPVLFFYPDVQTALRIRGVLGMQDPRGPYFDPASKEQSHKRITILPEIISEESKILLKQMYNIIVKELNSKEANDILVKASPKTALTKYQVQTRSEAKKPATSNSAGLNGEIQNITVYPPPPAKGGIAINTEDYICLAEDQFLNDVIIDFYLKYLMLQGLTRVDHDRTHVFSSYFYKRLTSPHTQAGGNTENVSAAARRHARVQKWTKNVNIFEKDFVVIPINEHAHWFLAIICFPGLVGKVSPKVEAKTVSQKLAEKKKKDQAKAQAVTIGNTTVTPVTPITPITLENDDGSERDEAEGDEDEIESDSDEEDESESKASADQIKTNPQIPQENNEVNKVPCILIFDSLAGASRVRVVATLRDYLKCEYKAKMGAEKEFSKDTIKGACPKVPQQSNFTDCGLYVLQYVESFFTTPITDYKLPIKTLKNWFEEIVVTRKREEIANLLKKLINNSKRVKPLVLPNLIFPTVDGKLRYKPENETKEAKAPETEEKKKSAEPGENKSNDTTSSTENTEASSSSSVSSNQTPTEDTSNVVNVQKVTPTTPNSKLSVDSLASLKKTRLPRLQKTENSEDKPAAKKYKVESTDSCK